LEISTSPCSIESQMQKCVISLGKNKFRNTNKTKMSFQKKTNYAFNMFYLDFLNDIKKQHEDLKQIVRNHFKIFDKSTSDHFNRIKESIQQYKDDFLKVELLPEISISEIINLLPNKDENTVKSYYHIFSILVQMTSDEDERILEKTLDIIKDIQQGENVDDKLKEVLDDELNTNLVNLKDCLQPKTNVANDILGMLENSKIGSLAKEISEEIDIKDLKIDSPEQLLDFKNLTGSNNILGDIVTKVGSKIKNKIDRGEISQTDLVNEAMSFVGMINKGSGSGGGGGGMDFMSMFNNPMFKDLMNNMGGFAGAAAGSSSSGGRTRVQVDKEKLRRMDTKERLRQKLEKKRGQGEKESK
jgi:hypothetical protein